MITEDTEKNVDNLYRNIVAEKTLLAYALKVDPIALSDVDRDLFTIYPYRAFYDILTAKKQTMTKDVLFAVVKSEYPTDKDEFKSFITKVFSVDLENYSRENIQVLKASLKHLYELRRLIDGLDKVSDMIGADKELDLEKARNILKQAIKQDVSDPDSGDILEDFPDNEQIILEKRDKQGEDSNLIGVPYGIDLLDNSTGGMLADEFILVGGQTNIGKSIFCQCVSGNAWKHGYNAIIFSLEMRKQQVQFRLYSFLTAIQYQKFRLGTITESELEEWREFYKSYFVADVSARNYLEVVYLTKDQTVDAIEGRIEKIQDKHGSKVDLVVVDYMNLLRPKNLKSGSSAKDANIQADISWELRLLSGSLNGLGCPIMTPVQLTDKAVKADILTSDHIKYSRGISENATAIYGLKQTEDDLTDGTMQLQTIKSRDGSKPKPITLRPNLDIINIHIETALEGDLSDL